MAIASLFAGPPAFASESHKTELNSMAAIFAGIGIIVISLVSALLAMIAYAAVSDPSLSAGDPSGFLTALVLSLSKSNIPRDLVAFAVMQVVMAGLTVLVVTRLRALGLQPPRQGLWIYLPAILVMIAVSSASTALWLVFDKETWQQDMSQFLPYMTSDLAPFMFLIGVVGAPISEELLFRGFLLPVLARSPIGFIGAAVLTSAAWTLMHAYSIPALIEIFLLGLFLSWLVWRTGSIRPAIFCHAFNNIVAFALMWYYIPPVTASPG